MLNKSSLQSRRLQFLSSAAAITSISLGLTLTLNQSWVDALHNTFGAWHWRLASPSSPTLAGLNAVISLTSIADSASSGTYNIDDLARVDDSSEDLTSASPPQAVAEGPDAQVAAPSSDTEEEPPLPSLSLSVSPPGAEISFKDSPLVYSPDMSISEGTYNVVVSSDEYIEQVVTIEVVAGENTFDISLELDPEVVLAREKREKVQNNYERAATLVDSGDVGGIEQLRDDSFSLDESAAIGEDWEALLTSAKEVRESTNRDYILLTAVNPVYPRRALARGITGSCVVEFSIAEDGTVEDPFPKSCNPSGVFEPASLNAIARFKFEPQITRGQAVRVDGAVYQFNFQLE